MIHDSSNAGTIEESAATPPRPVGGCAFLLGLAAGLAVLWSGNLALAALADGAQAACPAAWPSLAAPFLLAGVLGGTAAALLRRYGWDRAELGLRTADFRRQATRALCWELPVLPAMLLWLELTQQWIPEDRVNYVGGWVAAGGATWALAMALTIIVAPLAEELFFRGVLLDVLTRWTGARSGLILSSLLFGWAHGDFFRALPLALYGALLAHGRRRTGTLALPLTMHSLHNALLMVAASWGGKPH